MQNVQPDSDNIKRSYFVEVFIGKNGGRKMDREIEKTLNIDMIREGTFQLPEHCRATYFSYDYDKIGEDGKVADHKRIRTGDFYHGEIYNLDRAEKENPEVYEFMIDTGYECVVKVATEENEKTIIENFKITDIAMTRSKNKQTPVWEYTRHPAATEKLDYLK